MATVIVKHRVASFEDFKQIYDAGGDARKAHGWVRHTILRDAHDPNLVTIIHRVQSLERAKDYGASDEVRSAMQRGVLGPPEVTFLEEAEELSY